MSYRGELRKHCASQAKIGVMYNSDPDGIAGTVKHLDADGVYIAFKNGTTKIAYIEYQHIRAVICMEIDLGELGR